MKATKCEKAAAVSGCLEDIEKQAMLRSNDPLMGGVRNRDGIHTRLQVRRIYKLP